MAFKVIVTKGNKTLWQYQWATTPTMVQVEDVTLDDPSFKPALGDSAYAVYRSIADMVQDPMIVGSTLINGIDIRKEK